MRVYKLLNHYIDLDHVLAIGPMFHSSWPARIAIPVQLAFRDGPILYSWEVSGPDGIFKLLDLQTPPYDTEHSSWGEQCKTIATRAMDKVYHDLLQEWSCSALSGEPSSGSTPIASSPQPSLSPPHGATTSGAPSSRGS